jgi:nucleoside-diphosphate-sugar epimerase
LLRNRSSTKRAPLRVLITGAYGLVGNLSYAHLDAQPERHLAYGLGRRAEPSNRLFAELMASIPSERFRRADLGDSCALAEAVGGMDVVVHMAANPDGQAPWADTARQYRGHRERVGGVAEPPVWGAWSGPARSRWCLDTRWGSPIPRFI